MSTASTIKSLAAYDLIRDMILSGEAPSGMPSCVWTSPAWSRTSPTRGPSS